MTDYHVTESPDARDQYKQASAELLRILGRVVYPAPRDDPINENGHYPIRYKRGGWYTSEIETPSGGLYYLTYQAIEDLRRVMVFDLVSFREP